MKAALATIAWCVSNVPAWWRYRRALEAPAVVQHELLLQYVRRNGDTVFGRAHGFAGIRSVPEYQARVPLMRYEEYEPLIERVADGEAGVLTAEPVQRLAVTSGSTSAAKLIPYTATLQAEYARAVGPWIVDLYGARPGLAGGPAYWSITPRVASPRAPHRNVPIGFDADSRHLGGLAHRFVDGVMAVPGLVRDVEHHETHRYLTLLFLLRARNLRLISVWHPSYLALLIAAMRTHWEALLHDIRTGGVTPPAPLPEAVRRAVIPRLRPDRRRADELTAAGPDRRDAIWPALGAVSCWGHGAARGPLDELRRQWPHVFVQPKGLLATEAIVTLPFSGAARGADALEPAQLRPLAICSHFFEFLAEDGHACLADEVEPGATYGVVVTTGGGLYRYRLGDRVRVDGRVGRTPSLSFVGRDAHVSDRVGEKLHDTFVANVIARLFDGRRHPLFAMLAPERMAAGLSYTLFVETDESLPHALSERLETALQANPHYALAVALGQLAPARAVRIRDGFSAFARRAIARGQRLGDVKPVPLHREDGWSAVFQALDASAPAEDGACAVR